MQKLIELLNEYDKALGWEYEDGVLDCKLNLYEYMAYEWICSARYGFIKWLVENEKIDVERVYNNSDYPMVKRDEFLYEGLLMLLSISSSPIEDLISYLR